jgi:beta-glucanase (GH16 family)
MIKAGISFLVITMFLTWSNYLHAQPLDRWELVWSDEFNGTSLDTSKWALELNEGDPGIAVYTRRPQNVFVPNGCLALQALKENYNGKQYSSTQLSTRNKGFWRYCRVDVRAKLPRGQGMWPAIWMMPNNPAYGTWPRSGEIDNMENLGSNVKELYSTLHYGASNQSNQGAFSTGAAHTLADTFHIYTMIWDSSSFGFYLDSIHTYYNLAHWAPHNVSFPKPFDQPFFLIFDLAVGGTWPGNPDSTTVFPQQLLVDWVHVYQREGPAGAIQSSATRAANGFSLRLAGNILTYSLKTGAAIRAELFTIGGQKISTLVDAYGPAGRYCLDITDKTGKTGMYIRRFENCTTSGTQKIFLSR